MDNLSSRCCSKNNIRRNVYRSEPVWHLVFFQFSLRPKASLWNILNVRDIINLLHFIYFPYDVVQSTASNLFIREDEQYLKWVWGHSSMKGDTKKEGWSRKGAWMLRSWWFYRHPFQQIQFNIIINAFKQIINSLTQYNSNNFSLLL